tara:strand:+ start:834 stop:1307 length:474 start_codon:yes stop_codon:yes gene_type:complete
MKNNYNNIYNNLVKLTRNKKLYIKLEKQDTFSDRIIILFFHFAFFLEIYKSKIEKKELQKIFDFFINQIELSIREIGYGDVTVNKQMKKFINLLYSIIKQIDKWENIDFQKKKYILENYLNIEKNLDFFVNYFEKYRIFVKKNSLKDFLKDIIETKF